MVYRVSIGTEDFAKGGQISYSPRLLKIQMLPSHILNMDESEFF